MQSIEDNASQKDTREKSKHWHILFCFPTICSYYLFWFVYVYVLLALTNRFDKSETNKLTEHEKLIPFALLAMVVAFFSWSLLPQNSVFNISTHGLARFFSWLWSVALDDISRIKF